MKEQNKKIEYFLQSPFIKKGLWTLLSLLFLLIVWSVVCLIVGNEYLVPDLIQTLKVAMNLLGETSFWRAVLSTITRSLIAFASSFIIGGGFAVLAYVFPRFEKFFSPIISFFRSLPTMAVLLIIMLWSNSSIAPIIVAGLVLTPMCYASVYSSLVRVDKELIEMSVVYRVPMIKRIKRLYLPSALPSVCGYGARNLSFALKLVVSAEIMSNTFQSIGGEMQFSALYDKTPLLFALTLFVFLSGYLLECLGLLGCKLFFSGGEKE